MAGGPVIEGGRVGSSTWESRSICEEDEESTQTIRFTQIEHQLRALANAIDYWATLLSRLSIPMPNIQTSGHWGWPWTPAVATPRGKVGRSVWDVRPEEKRGGFIQCSWRIGAGLQTSKYMAVSDNSVPWTQWRIIVSPTISHFQPIFSIELTVLQICGFVHRTLTWLNDSTEGVFKSGRTSGFGMLGIYCQWS